MVLKNNRGVEENRVRHMDYGVQINKLMYTTPDRRAKTSPYSRLRMFRVYMTPSSLIKMNLKRLYVKYEQDESIKRTEQVKAIDLFSIF